MNPIVRNLVVPVCVVAIGAGFIAWHLHDMRATERRFSEQVKQYQAGTDRGNADAEYELGRMYLWGRGVPQDYAQANYWFQKAADHGLAKAKYAIGDLYYYGDGVSQNYSEAIVWYRKAADHGDATAEHALGLMSYYGHGVPQSYTEAMVWYRKAADQGYAKSEYDIGGMYWYGEGVSRDRDEANRWYRRAANHGDEDAQRWLGLRFSPLGTFGKIINATQFVAGLVLLSGLFYQRGSFRDRNQRNFALGGALCLVKASMGFYTHSEYCLFPNAWSATTCQFTTSFLGGVVVTILVTIIWPKAGKILFIVSGSLILAVTSFFCVVARFDAHALSIVRWHILICNASLIGTAIPAVLWWRRSKGPESSAPEPPSENGEITHAV